MTDDPRDILKAAGVECAEVEAWAEQVFTGEFSEMKTASEALSIIGPLREVVVTSNAAILAVARLVAEQTKELKKQETFIALLKGMVEQLEDDEVEGGYDLDDLLRRVDEARNA